MANYKLKLTSNTNKTDSNAPQYSLSYNADKRGADLNASYEVLSLLKEDNDIVMEVDTSLIIGAKKNKEFIPEDFISEIRKLNLEYSYKRNESVKQDFFSMLFSLKKTREEHVITVYVPDSVWKDEIFKSIIPDCGVRYYIKKKTDEPRKVLDNMNTMTDNEKKDYFTFVIFDATMFNQMGISSNHYGYEDIKRILGIS
ncbi:MAG TPA: hypothetical protein GXZ22_02220 [Clostridiaceae bacterium]|nr:hypothetical protein [Clostridiaceae bacterium]